MHKQILNLYFADYRKKWSRALAKISVPKYVDPKDLTEQLALFSSPVKSSKVKPTTQIETYTFRSVSTTVTKDNRKNIITKYIIKRTAKGDRKATYADALKALPLGTYKKGSTIDVTLSEPVYTYKKIKSTSLFSTVYLVAEVKDFPAEEKVKLEILEQDGVLASKGTTIQFIDKTKAEVTTVEVTVSNEGKKQYAVEKVTLSRIDEINKKSWAETMEKAKDKKSHLKLKATSIGGLCDAKKSLKKVELLGGCDVAPWMEIAIGESLLGKGTKESSSTLYPMVKKYHNYVGWTFKTKKACYRTAWCASFVSWTLNEAGYKNPKTVASRSYISHKTLKKIDTPIFGAIAIFSDCSKSGVIKSSGHVAFVYGTLPNNKMAILGGNQGDRLKISSYDCSGNVFVSYKKRKKNKKTGKYYYKYFYKKLRHFSLPKTYEISDTCKSRKLKHYTSTKMANKALLTINIKENSNGESSR